MDSTVQLFATLADEILKADHVSILGGTRIIGAGPCVVQRSLKTGVNGRGRSPVGGRRSGDASREGVIPHPIVGERALEIEPRGKIIHNYHRCTRVGRVLDGIKEGRSAKASIS